MQLLLQRGLKELLAEEYNGDHRNRMMGKTGRLANEVSAYFWLPLDADK